MKRFLGFTHFPRRMEARYVWYLHQSLGKTDSVPSFINEVRAQCQKEREWNVDFTKLTEKASKLGVASTDECELLIGRVGAVLANSGHSPQSLHLTLPSMDSVRVAELCFDTKGFLSDILSLNIVVQSSILTSSKTVQEEESPTSPGMVQLAQMFLALREHAPQSLHTFSLTAVDTNLEAESTWTDVAISGLAAFLERVKLSSLSLNYVNCQACTKVVLLALAQSFLSSAETLQVLDLKGMRAFIHYSKFFTTRVVDELHALQQLEISYTHIGEVTFRDVLRALHKGIGGWYHLKTLGVAQCDLGEYAVELLSRDVREIDSGDEIALEEINFSSNKLQDETIFLLSTCLALCTQLKRLDLRHNSITKRSIAEVASSLSKASGLRVLHVRSNRIGDEGLADLLRYVVHWPALEELDLTRCRLTCRSLPALSEALPQLSSLKVLNLSGNDLRLVQEMKDDIPVGDLKLFVHDPAYLKGGSGKVPTSFALDRRDREAGRVRYKGPTVEELEGEKPSSAKVNVFAHFGEALSSCRSLEVLDLSDTVLEDGSFTNLAQTLTLPKLRELRLGSNPLFAGAQTSLDHLVSLLWSSNELEVLDLAFTGIGDLGLTVLCDGTSEGCEGVLGSLHQLRILHLSHCRANKLGLESLCARLGDFSKLERLAYDGNCSPNEGLEELLGRAAALASLEFLGLTGCTPLREGLRSCEAYRTLREKGVVILV